MIMMIGDSIKEILGMDYSAEDFSLSATHRSVGEPNNERWEFLGNAILNMHLATIVHGIRPELDPKEMTLICNNARSNENLNEIGRNKGLDEHIITGPSTKGKVEDDMVSTAFEAIIGMLFDRSGIEASNRFIDEFIIMDEKNIERYKEKDPITTLKEFRDKCGGCWKIEENKDEGASEFHHSISYDGKFAKGYGSSKKAAKMDASEKMLKQLGI